MSKAVGTSVIQGFSKPGVHSLTYKDDFCNFAFDVREELLHYPKWKEMMQEGIGGGGLFSPHRQNGITTGHLRDQDRERLPQCIRFGEFLSRNFATLCPLVGVNPADAQFVELNAMAYGTGGWLSPHTDFFEYRHAEGRLAAWMLYLTAPEDGEWSAEKGGAVRLWEPGGEEARIRPRFNRFAIFRVHNNSFHEIEKIMWETEWRNCRLALSGWIQGRPAQVVGCDARLYVQSPSARERSEELEVHLQGSLAFHRLQARQKAYCGIEMGATAERISELEQDYRAHCDAPAGTNFLRRVPGPAGCIIVVDEAGNTVYFGTGRGMSRKSGTPPET